MVISHTRITRFKRCPQTRKGHKFSPNYLRTTAFLPRWRTVTETNGSSSKRRSILNCGLAAVRHLQAKQCQRCHCMGSQLYFSLSKAMRLQLKHGTWQWNQAFYNISSRVWAGGMQVWAPLPHDGQLLFHRFRGKKEASLLETPAKLENIRCLCLPNLQGKCYCFKALGTKDRGAQPTVP